MNHPVVLFSFNQIDYKNNSLEQAIDGELERIAKSSEITLERTNNKEKFIELIHKLGREKQVVLLIDEYDKPLIDYLDDLQQAKNHQEILKSFYSAIKDNDAYIKFVMVTWVSKFAKVSIFSDLNHLSDITVDKNFSDILVSCQA
jgi:ERCC4-type nuclease